VSTTVRFAYTVLYVEDVARAMDFYERAFGFRRRHLDEEENGAYGELESGETTLAFASPELVARHVPVSVRHGSLREPPPGVELALVSDDLDGCYRSALALGAVDVAPPAEKPWGQTVAFVRDLDGFLISLSSEPAPSR
jgi:lactoylglutathione lyase